MNKDLLNKTADMIEAACQANADPEVGFNMSAYVSYSGNDKTGHACGTTACIAGWAILASGQKLLKSTIDEPSIADRAEELLGLTHDQALELFLGPDDTDLRHITPQQAVVAIRNLVETGEVIWEALP